MKNWFVFALLFLGPICYSTEYYVAIDGNDLQDGLSENSAWRTVSHAAKMAKAGDMVWIKAGDYGNENVVVQNNGTKDNPISFIGYKNEPGDITTMYYDYAKDKALKASEMPLLSGKDRGTYSIGIELARRSYVVIKNIQVTNYSKLISGGGGAHDIYIENVVAKDAGSFTENTMRKGSGYGMLFGDDTSHHITIKNSVVMNGTSLNIRLYGSNNLIDNVKSISDEGSAEDGKGEIAATDYYIVIRGNNNIVRNCYIERVGNLNHGGHGICLKSVGVKTENNLVEDCEIVNVAGAIELRHHEVKNNIVRGIKVKGPSGTIVIRDGASKNLVENIVVSNTNEGLRFYDQTESGQGGVIASENVIRNSIFYNLKYGLISTKSRNVSAEGEIKDNIFENCTFHNIETLYSALLPMDESNMMVNCTFSKIARLERTNSKYRAGWINLNNNFFDNGYKTVLDNGNMEYNPHFIDPDNGNFKLDKKSKLIDAGKKIENLDQDYDGNPRPKGSSHDIGAYEYQGESTSSIKANAGEDKMICLGEEVTLNASGGSAYLWSTGETTPSIKVSPLQTTTYTVTVTEGGVSDTDHVKVEINKVEANAGPDKTIVAGESVVLGGSGGDFYSWSTGENTQEIVVSPLESTTYKLLVSKGNCEDEAEVTIHVIPSPQESVVEEFSVGEDKTICHGDSIVLSGSAAEKYEWSNGEITQSIEISPERTTTYVLRGLINGSFYEDSVTVTVQNCQEASEQSFESRANANISIYPNPVRENLHLEIKDMGKNITYHLINLKGQILLEDSVSMIPHERVHQNINTSQLTKGVYFMRFFSQNESLVRKIIVI